MRLIVEDRDGLSGAFYAHMQEMADLNTGGKLAVGPYTGVHVTILAIETEEGQFGWLSGHRDDEAARTLRQAAAVLAREALGGTRRDETIAYLIRQAEHLEHSCAACGPQKGTTP
jgi:hypothetical protein